PVVGGPVDTLVGAVAFLVVRERVACAVPGIGVRVVGVGGFDGFEALVRCFWGDVLERVDDGGQFVGRAALVDVFDMVVVAVDRPLVEVGDVLVFRRVRLRRGDTDRVGVVRAVVVLVVGFDGEFVRRVRSE